MVSEAILERQRRIAEEHGTAKRTPESITSLSSGFIETMRERQINYKEAQIRNNAGFYDEEGRERIPENIDCLIDNKSYHNRHKFLIRTYGLEIMNKVAELAQTKDEPSHWYARATQKKNNNWEACTLPMIERLLEKEARIRERLVKMGANIKYLPYFLKAETLLHYDLLDELIEKSMKKKQPIFYLRKCVADELARLR